jgi:hypothetical protein
MPLRISRRIEMATPEQIKAAKKQRYINISVEFIALVLGTLLLCHGTNWQTGVGLALLLIYNKSNPNG